MKRRDFITGLLGAATGIGLTLSGSKLRHEIVHDRENNAKRPSDWQATLKYLMEGNKRYVHDRAIGPRRNDDRMEDVALEQAPLAAILCCSDSRVIPEVLFDQGIGDLFVTRVAGNVVDSGSAVKGSMEYAVEQLHVPLIIVLGHKNCGAVRACLEFARDGFHISNDEAQHSHLTTIVSEIKPAFEAVMNLPGDPIENTVRMNVHLSVNRLKSFDWHVTELVKAGKVAIVGAVYDIKTGVVDVMA